MKTKAIFLVLLVLSLAVAACYPTTTKATTTTTKATTTTTTTKPECNDWECPTSTTMSTTTTTMAKKKRWNPESSCCGHAYPPVMAKPYFSGRSYSYDGCLKTIEVQRMIGASTAWMKVNDRPWRLRSLAYVLMYTERYSTECTTWSNAGDAVFISQPWPSDWQSLNLTLGSNG
jgi:hypothetical protein